jgi:hypothetical protein
LFTVRSFSFAAAAAAFVAADAVATSFKVMGVAAYAKVHVRNSMVTVLQS